MPNTLILFNGYYLIVFFPQTPQFDANLSLFCLVLLTLEVLFTLFFLQLTQ